MRLVAIADALLDPAQVCLARAVPGEPARTEVWLASRVHVLDAPLAAVAAALGCAWVELEGTLVVAGQVTSLYSSKDPGFATRVVFGNPDAFLQVRAGLADVRDRLGL